MSLSLPTPIDVEECRNLPWSANHIQHMQLMLIGICEMLLLSSAHNPGLAPRLIKKHAQIEKEIDQLDALKSKGPEIKGSDFSDIALTWMACTTEQQLAQCMGLGIEFVLAGRDAMGRIARRKLCHLTHFPEE